MKSVPISIVLACGLALLAGGTREADGAPGRRLIAAANAEKFALEGEDGVVQIVKSDDSSTTRISLGGAAEDLSLSPDGAALGACLRNGSLVVADTTTGNVRTLDSAAACLELAWSKDGGKLYYLSTKVNPGQREPEELLEVKMVNVKSGDKRGVHSTRRRFPFPPIPRSTQAVPQAVGVSAPPPVPPASKIAAPAKAPPPADKPPKTAEPADAKP